MGDARLSGRRRGRWLEERSEERWRPHFSSGNSAVYRLWRWRRNGDGPLDSAPTLEEAHETRRVSLSTPASGRSNNPGGPARLSPTNVGAVRIRGAPVPAAVGASNHRSARIASISGVFLAPADAVRIERQLVYNRAIPLARSLLTLRSPQPSSGVRERPVGGGVCGGTPRHMPEHSVTSRRTCAPPREGRARERASITAADLDA
jgi:hypothetical protein